MAASSDATDISEKLLKRAHAISSFRAKNTRPEIATPLETCSKYLQACASMAKELEAAQATRKGPSNAVPASNVSAKMADMTDDLLTIAYPKLLKIAQDLSVGKDPEVVKALLKEFGTQLAKIGTILSGLEYIKVAWELLEAMAEIAHARDLTKLRKKQVEMASDLFGWMEQLLLATRAWYCLAYRWLLQVQGKGIFSAEELWDKLPARMLSQPGADL